MKINIKGSGFRKDVGLKCKLIDSENLVDVENLRELRMKESE